MRYQLPFGIFVAIEGGDGAGGTTQAGILSDLLQKLGISVFLTREQDEDFDTGRLIRDILLRKVTAPDPLQKQWLYAQNRRQHMGRVDKALAIGQIVVSARSVVSSFVYGMAEGIDIEALVRLNAGLTMPDLIFILQTPIEEAGRRRVDREVEELHDTPAMQARVAELYEWIARNPLQGGLCMPPILLDGMESREMLALRAALEVVRVRDERLRAWM